MEIIDNAKHAFNSYFKLFKKQPTKNPESNMHFLNLIIDTLALPSHLNNDYKLEILENWNILKNGWVGCTIEPSNVKFHIIENTFNIIVELYCSNNVITSWYENEYKQNLLHTANNIENNKYIWTIKNLQHHASAYASFYDSKYGQDVDL